MIFLWYNIIREVNYMFRILVADDDHSTRLYLKTVLESEKYTVFTAANGEEALDIIDTQHIDIILLDVMMPQLDGYKFTEELRNAGNDIPILMISAKQLPSDKRQGFLSGTDDYITKPIDEMEMLLRIKALLRRAKIVNERKITIGNLVLDYDSYSVIKNDTVIKLPQKEFQLLFKLLSYPGKTFTRIQLMDEIWGAESNTGWETVTVHIGRLRKKFEGYEEFEIESVIGLGYRAVKKI